jgi:hypothetical protein
MKLQVFGKLRLINENDKQVYTAPLSLLIATYIVMEHQGKIKREELYEIFFPMKPDCPDNFNAVSKTIYEQLWQYGISARYSKENPYTINHDDSDNLESAHKQLEAYEILKKYTFISENTWKYQLSDKFEKYIYKIREIDRNDEKKYTKRIIKTVSTQIDEMSIF